MALLSTDGYVFVYKIDGTSISKIAIAQLAVDGHIKNPVPRVADIALHLVGDKPVIYLFEKSGRFKVMEIVFKE